MELGRKNLSPIDESIVNTKSDGAEKAYISDGHHREVDQNLMVVEDY